MFRKSIPTKLFSTNVLFSCAKLQPIAINRSLTQYVINKNNFSNTLMSPKNSLIDNEKYFSTKNNKQEIIVINKKYFSTQNNKQEIIVIDKKYLSTQNNKHDYKNVDYYMNKYKYYTSEHKIIYYLLTGLFGLCGLLLCLCGLFVAMLIFAFVLKSLFLIMKNSIEIVDYILPWDIYD